MRALVSYRRAFEVSRFTNIEALRRCEELARSVVEVAGEGLGGPVCVVQPEWVPVACTAIAVDCNLERCAPPGDAVWWPALLRGERSRRQRAFGEARREFKVALTEYMTSTGRQGAFLDAWSLFFEVERAAAAECHGRCELGDLLDGLGDIFKRFGQGCHGSTEADVAAACEERNRLRFVRAVRYASFDGDFQSAANLLTDAYHDCVALSSARLEDASGEVLRCWRTYGRRALLLRAHEAGSDGPVDTRQIEASQGLVSAFVFRDMARTCASGTRQTEVSEACAFLERLGQASDKGRTDESLRTLTLAVVPVPSVSGVGEGVNARGSEVKSLMESPLFDQLLGGEAMSPHLVDAQRDLVNAQIEAIGQDACTATSSWDAWEWCTFGRILHVGVGSLAPVKDARRAPHRRRVGVGAMVMSALGGTAVLVGGLVGREAERDLATWGETFPFASAAEMRRSEPFQRVEAANRTMVGGIVVAGVGLVLGSTLLIVDAVRGRSSESRRGAVSPSGIRFMF